MDTLPVLDGSETPEPAKRRRRIGPAILSVLAGLLVLIGFVGPSDIGHLTIWEMLRIPVEGLVAAALLLALPPRPRRVLAIVLGVLLGVLTMLKLFDIGFSSVLNRLFDPVLDGILLGPAYDWLRASFGTAGAVGAVVVALALAVGVLVGMTRSVLRLTRLAVAHRTLSVRVVAVLAVAWLGCAAFGVPVASDSTSALVYAHGVQINAGFRDKGTFAGQLADDPYRNVPSARLLTGLRGHDVVFDVVESYGRVAVQDPAVGAVLDDGTRQLAAAGYSARSGFLTSPVFGANSWLAHGTFFSGLQIGSNQRYDALVKSDRLTLSKAFQEAGWRTVAVMPGTNSPWHEDGFYGLDKVYDFFHLGYKGPSFSWSAMPDQYTYAAFQRDEYGKPNRGPVMAEIVTVTSHAPWEPLPRMVSWDAVGDGSIFNAQSAKGDLPEGIVNMNPTVVRANYMKSVQYAMTALVSYVKTYGDQNLVWVFFGDHQPSPIVTGQGATHDVPVTIVAHDPSVLDRIAGWGFTPGLKPAPDAPVWPMESFRDRFLSTFGSAP